MKIGICVENKYGYELLDSILEKNVSVDFIVTRKDDPYKKDLIDFSGKLFNDTSANSEELISYLKEEKVDLVILLWWSEIIKKESIDSVSIGWINLHPSLLPYNRGKHPYFWAITDGTPFGVSIHFIDEDIDTGKILFQKEIIPTIEDTGESLYKKSVECLINLFKEKFDDIISLKFIPKEQNNSSSTYHSSKDIDMVSEINLEQTYKAKYLINILRARTFKNKPSSYFFLNDKKYYIRLEIEGKDD